MDEYIYIISIDPGNNLGISIFKIGLPYYNILEITNKQYILDNLVDKDLGKDKLLYKLLALQNIITGLVNMYNPHAIIAEAAFLNIRFPKAVMQLSSYIATIELTAISINKYIKLFRYPPKLVKRLIGAGGNAKKDDMTIAIDKIPDIANLVDTSVLTEHEIDSLAIGYVGIEEIRAAPHIMYTL